MRTTVVVTSLVLLVTSCGGGELTLTEYAEQVEGLTTTMYRTLDDVTVRMSSGAPSVEDVQAAYTSAAGAYRTLHDGLQGLEPPKDIADLHTAAVDLADQLATTGEAFAQRAQEVETPAELGPLFAGPEARAAEAAQIDMVAFCQERQAELDETVEREALADTPWIPPRMKEVVLVALGCDRDPSDGDS